MPTRLITGQELAKGSPLGGNIDIDKYSSVIDECQVFVLEPILGTKLYDKIVADFLATTITGIYAQILDNYLKPILIHSVAAEYITIGGFMVANAGILRYTPEGSTPANKSEIEFLANNQRGKADVYIERLQRFLCDKMADIPEYTLAQDNVSDIRPDRDLNTYGGLYLGRNRSDGTNAMNDIFKDIYFENGGR